MYDVIIQNKYITHPGQLGVEFTVNDGLGMYRIKSYLIRDTVIDLSALPLEEMDECCSSTWGASATFERCVIRGAGKLFLCGSGDPDKREVEQSRRVKLRDCILEGFGRRGPEVQAGMRVTMEYCLIRNWGEPSRFDVRSFASWAHHGGRIDAIGCVWWQDRFSRPLGQFVRDLAAHIGQAWNDEGWLGLLRPSTYLPGVCRGLLAGPGGEAYAWRCWRNRWWIMLPWRTSSAMMPKDEALELVDGLEEMAERLDTELRNRCQIVNS